MISDVESEAALFVDLPNFYSRLLKSGMGESRFLRDYFVDWLDFDLLARSLTETYSGIWVFYSGDRIGPSSERLKDEFLRAYIRRVNALQGVTARDVNIRGEQREPVPYVCSECKHEGISEAVSEKGVDSSLVVHLFDTMDSWSTAFLLSGDADFVPAVASLRRRGRIVIGVGFSDASEALVRECYNYIDIQDTYLKDDILAYSLYKRDGVVPKWFSDDVHYDTKFAPPETIELYAKLSDANRIYPESPYLHLFLRGPVDLTTRHQMMAALKDKYPERVQPRRDTDNRLVAYTVGISAMALDAIARRGRNSLSSIPGLVILPEREYMVTYRRNADTGKFDPVIPAPRLE